MSISDSRATSLSLLARVQASDSEAWDRLVALYAPFVYRYCRTARMSDDDARDVFQEVFHAVLTRIASFEARADGGSFRGWLRTIATNKVRDHFRLKERGPSAVGGSEIRARLAEVPAPEPQGDEQAHELAEHQLLRDALDQVQGAFQDRTWRAFVGTALEGRTPSDVGEDLGMSTGAVRVAKSRVLARLRAELGD